MITGEECMCVWLGLFAVRQNLTEHCKSTKVKKLKGKKKTRATNKASLVLMATVSDEGRRTGCGEGTS